jgi:hypothetical protein
MVKTKRAVKPGFAPFSSRARGELGAQRFGLDPDGFGQGLVGLGKAAIGRFASR